MNGLDCPFRRKENPAVAEYNEKVAKELQSRWPGHTLEILELIQERKQERKETAAGRDGEKNKRYDYVVFIDIAGDLDWICDDDHSEEHLEPKTAALAARALSIEAMPCKQLSQENRMAFKRLLGAAIVSAFEGSHDDAQSLMLQAQTFLKDRTEEQSRRWMLLSSTPLLLAFALLLYWWFSEPVRVPMLFGLFGAYVSIVRSSGSRRTDAGAGKQLHFVEAVVRLVVGMLLGNVGVQFFNCPIAPELLRGLCETDARVRTAAFCAGFLDHFIPSMISAYFLKPLENQTKGATND